MGLYIQLHRFEGPEAVKLLSREITSWQKRDKHNHTLKALAQRANLSPQTVKRLWARQTFEPRHTTIFRILGALGFVAARLDTEDEVEQSPKKRSQPQFRVLSGGKR